MGNRGPGKKRKKLAPDGYADGRPVWERQEEAGESEPAYAAFRTYLVLPYVERTEKGELGSRSIARAAEEVGKSVTLLKGWSADWRWPERAAAYDRDRRRSENEAEMEEDRQAARRAARRRRQMRDEAWGLYQKVRSVVLELLSWPITTEEVEEVPLEDGTVQRIVRKPAEGWTPAVVSALVRNLATLGVLATDDGKGHLDALLGQIDPEQLTDEQIAALVNGEDPIRALLAGSRLLSSGEGGETTEREDGGR